MMPSLLNPEMSPIARTNGLAYHRTADGLHVYLVYRDDAFRLVLWRDDRAASQADVTRVQRAIALPVDVVVKATEREWIVWVVGPSRRRCARAAQVATHGGFTLTWPDATTFPVPLDLSRVLRAWLGCARRRPSSDHATRYLRYAQAMLVRHHRLRWDETLTKEELQLLTESASKPIHGVSPQEHAAVMEER